MIKCLNNVLFKIILVLLLLVATICIRISANVFEFKENSTFQNQGTYWTSDDSNISFCVFREKWYYKDLDVAKEMRYVGFGEMKINNEKISISCICNDREIRICQFGYDTDYQAEQPIIDIRFYVKQVYDNEAVVTIQHIFTGESFFSKGDTIQFFKHNNSSEINPNEYEFYVDANQMINAIKNNSKIDIFESVYELNQAKLSITN